VAELGEELERNQRLERRAREMEEKVGRWKEMIVRMARIGRNLGSNVK